MAAILKWKQPKQATDLEIESMYSGLKSIRWRYIFILCIALTSPMLYFIYRWDPTSLPSALKYYILAVLAVCLYGWTILHFNLRFSYRYFEITEKGLRKRSSNLSTFDKWNNVEWYHLSENSELSGLRYLEFKPRPTKSLRNKWYFDPAEVNESELLAILEEHLLGKKIEGTC